MNSNYNDIYDFLKCSNTAFKIIENQLFYGEKERKLKNSTSQNGLYDEIIPLAMEFVDPNSPRDSSSQNGLYDEIIPLAEIVVPKMAFMMKLFHLLQSLLIQSLPEHVCYL
ncbi:unnamed protein product [Gordionus sp. m RMFG-2023]